MKSLATNVEGTILLRTEHEHYVEVWNLTTKARMYGIETTFNIAAAVDFDGETVFVSASEKKGIAAYRCATGEEIWRRCDMSGRGLKISKTDPLLYTFKRTSCDVLNRHTGRTKKQMRGVRDLWESHCGDEILVEMSGTLQIRLNDKCIASIQREQFATLDACFAPDCVVFSEARGDIRCCSLPKGKEKWRYLPPDDTHVLRVAYRPDVNVIVALQWNPSYGGPYTLLELQPDSGVSQNVGIVDRGFAETFGLQGSVIVLSDGRIFSTQSGNLVNQLAVA
jgi:hypothetical protein